MNINQFALYQLKNIPKNREKRFHPYHELQEKGISVQYGDYEQVYFGRMQPDDTPEDIRRQFDKKMPRTCRGHAISVGDVLVLNKGGAVTSYYVEKTGFTVLTGFIPTVFHGAPVSLNTTDFHIEGKEGSWLAFDSQVIDGKPFFLMEHETYGRDAAWVVVDEGGKLVVDGVYNGFDQTVEQQIRDYLNLPQPAMEPAVQEKIPAKSKQKENDGFLHHAESCAVDKNHKEKGAQKESKKEKCLAMMPDASFFAF